MPLLLAWPLLAPTAEPSLDFETEPEAALSYFTLETSGSSSLYFDVDKALASRNRLLFGGSQMMISVLAGLDLPARTLSVGYGSDSNRPNSFNGKYQYTFFGQDIQAHDLLGSMVTASENWSLSFTPQLGVITIYPPSGPSVDVTKTGLGISAEYYPGQHWRFSAGAQEYRYRGDTTQLPQVLDHFVIRLMGFASGFMLSRTFVEGGYDMKRGSVGMGWDKSVALVDRTRTDSLYLKLDRDLTEATSLRVELGYSLSIVSGSTVSGGFGVIGLTVAR